MEPDDKIDLPAKQDGEKLVAAIETVGQQHVLGLEVAHKLPGKAQFVGFPCLAGKGDQMAGVQAEQCDELADRKTTALLLASGVVEAAAIVV